MPESSHEMKSSAAPASAFTAAEDTATVSAEYLCRYTIDLGKSLGSLSGQLDSLLAYLNDYNPNLLDRLKNAEDVDTAATSFMREYEKCANQGTQQKLRTTAAEQIYNVMESYDSPVDVE